MRANIISDLKNVCACTTKIESLEDKTNMLVANNVMEEVLHKSNGFKLCSKQDNTIKYQAS